MRYRFFATKAFWRSYNRLSPKQKESAKKAWQIFRVNPFDARLGAHKIHHLSAHYGRTTYSAVIETNLRLLFYVEGEQVISLLIDSHDMYRK
jgi:hypothetical protein